MSMQSRIVVESPEMAKKTANFLMRMDPEIKAQIEAAAKSQDRSVANFVVWLFKEWQKKEQSK